MAGQVWSFHLSSNWLLWLCSKEERVRRSWSMEPKYCHTTSSSRHVHPQRRVMGFVKLPKLRVKPSVSFIHHLYAIMRNFTLSWFLAVPLDKSSSVFESLKKCLINFLWPVIRPEPSLEPSPTRDPKHLTKESWRSLVKTYCNNQGNCLLISDIGYKGISCIFENMVVLFLHLYLLNCTIHCKFIGMSFKLWVINVWGLFSTIDGNKQEAKSTARPDSVYKPIWIVPWITPLHLQIVSHPERHFVIRMLKIRNLLQRNASVEIMLYSF